MHKQPPPAPTASTLGPGLIIIQISRMPALKVTQHHRLITIIYTSALKNLAFNLITLNQR